MDEKIDEVFSDGSAMWREWRTTGLLRGFRWESVLVVAQWVGSGRGGLIQGRNA